MGVLGNLYGALKSKGFSLLDWSGYAAGRPAWNPRDFESLAREGYVENAYGYACINEIAKAAAGIPLVLFKDGPDGARVPVTKHPLLNVLRRPNKSETGGQLVEAFITYWLLNGTTYIVKLGKPVDWTQPLTQLVGLKCPRPNLVRVLPDYLGAPEGFEIGNTGGSVRRIYDPSRVIMLKNFHPTDPVMGLSPLSVAGKDLDILNALLNYVFRLLTRNGRPDGVIISKAGMNGEQYERFKKDINNKLNNPNRAGGWHVIEGDADVKEFAFKPGDMTLSPTELARIRSVCSVFGVPPECVGVAEVKTYSNYQEARKALYQETVLPLMDVMCEKLEQELLYDEAGNPVYEEGLRLGYDKAGIEALREDTDKVWKRALDSETAGEITNNEYRSMVGLPKSTDPAADMRLVSYSRIPVEELLAGGVGSGTGGTTATPANDANPDASGDGSGDGAAQQNSRTWNRRWVVNGRAVRALPMHLAGAGPDLWLMYDRTRLPFQRAARSVFYKVVLGDYQAIAAAVQHGVGNVSELGRIVDGVLADRRSAMSDALREVYFGTGQAFAEAVDAGLADSLEPKLSAKPGLQRRRAAVASNRRGIQDTWGLWIESYLNTVSGSKISNMSATTRARVLGAASSAYADGVGAEGIAAAILAAAPIAAAGRALVIARTEVIGASNAGSQAAAMAFGVPLNKSWLATGDSRTREDHAEAGGHPPISMTQPYNVGGSQLMFPGDTSMGAAAKEVVQCRCAETYDVADDGVDPTAGLDG